MTLSHGYEYVLVMMCMFSYWIEALSCRHANDSVVDEKIIPTWGNPLKVYSDGGTYYTGHVLQLCAAWQHFHLLTILNLHV